MITHAIPTPGRRVRPGGVIERAAQKRRAPATGMEEIGASFTGVPEVDA